MKAIIFYGPPGSGKGTQAKLLADEFSFFHFDTGDFLRKLLNDPKLRKNKTIRKERLLNESGKLNTPSFVLKILSRRVAELANLGQSVVFSGSPRTFFEAFGGGKTEGLADILEKRYGKKNISVFVLEIPEKESVKRNSARFVCSVCKTPLLNPDFQKKGFKFRICPFCGGKIIHRVDDNPSIIMTRLREYKERTEPILAELKKRKYEIHEINGALMPDQIHKRIISFLDDND